MSLRGLLNKIGVGSLAAGAGHLAVKAGAGRGRLADLYYLLAAGFRQEHRAVLYGQSLHLRNGTGTGACADARSYELRRNIHRLEKGLIMRPRRDVFARDFIEQTVDLFAVAVASGEDDEGARLLQGWAMDVLHAYFQVVAHDPAIDRARVEYEETVQRHGLVPGTSVPYQRDLSPLSISYEQMLQLARRRRSVRWYLQKPVPRELIDNAIQVAIYCPSACNRQPFEFRIYDDREMIRKVAEIPMGSKGFLENFPALAVIVGSLRAFPFERDRHIIYIDASLAAMAFQFALEVQGLSSCCINWPEIPNREALMAETLKLEPDQRVILLISLGYPDPEGMVPYSQKKTLDAIRSYNRL